MQPFNKIPDSVKQILTQRRSLDQANDLTQQLKKVKQVTNIYSTLD